MHLLMLRLSTPWLMEHPFFGGEEAESASTPSTQSQTWPAIDVKDAGKSLIVIAELPGYKKENVKLEITAKTLTIIGNEIKKKTKKKGKNIMSERVTVGEFSRTISLPSQIDESKCKAKFDNGLLLVFLDKLEKKSGTNIPIE